jgi:hypothetical protein
MLRQAQHERSLSFKLLNLFRARSLVHFLRYKKLFDSLIIYGKLIWAWSFSQKSIGNLYFSMLIGQ